MDSKVVRPTREECEALRSVFKSRTSHALIDAYIALLDSHEQTIQQCAEIAENWNDGYSVTGKDIAAEIRKLASIDTTQTIQQLQVDKERLHKKIETDPAEIEWICEVQRNSVHAIVGGGTGWESMLWTALTMMLEHLDTLRAVTDYAARGVQLGTDGQTVGNAGSIGGPGSSYTVIRCGVCGGYKQNPYILHSEEHACKCPAEGVQLASSAHPEDRCQNCGGLNVVWNMVVGSESGILCPACFIKRADAKGLYRGGGWRLSTETEAKEE